MFKVQLPFSSCGSPKKNVPFFMTVSLFVSALTYGQIHVDAGFQPIQEDKIQTESLSLQKDKTQNTEVIFPVDQTKDIDLTDKGIKGSVISSPNQKVYIYNNQPVETKTELQSQNNTNTQTTVENDSMSLTGSSANKFKQLRKDAEIQTEVKIVEKLEESRLDDERKRAERLFGDRWTGMGGQHGGVPETLVPRNAPEAVKNYYYQKYQQEQLIVDPHAPLTPVPIQQPGIPQQQHPSPNLPPPNTSSAVAPSQSTDLSTNQETNQTVQIQENNGSIVVNQQSNTTAQEIKGEELNHIHANLDSSVEQVALKQQDEMNADQITRLYFFGGHLGLSHYFNTNNTKSNLALGLSGGFYVTPLLVTQGEFIYSSHSINESDFENDITTDMNQYNLSGLVKYLFLDTPLKPVVGVGLSYVYRSFSQKITSFYDTQSFNDYAQTHAFDFLGLIGVHYDFSQQMSFGATYRYMKNITNWNSGNYSYSDCYRCSPIEKLSNNHFTVDILIHF